jgi:hypothetical protein
MRAKASIILGLVLFAALVYYMQPAADDEPPSVSTELADTVAPVAAAGAPARAEPSAESRRSPRSVPEPRATAAPAPAVAPEASVKTITLSGRVLRGEDMTPVAGIACSVAPRGPLEDGPKAVTGEDGCFAIEVPMGRQVEWVEVEDSTRAQPPIALVGRTLKAPFDVGDIVIPPRLVARVFVHDQDGAPIEGAVCAWIAAGARPSAARRTGADGRAELDRLRAGGQLAIGARGYAFLQRTVDPGDAPCEVDVCLVRGGVLTVKARHSSGWPLPPMTLRIEAPALGALELPRSVRPIPGDVIAAVAHGAAFDRRLGWLVQTTIDSDTVWRGSSVARDRELTATLRDAHEIVRLERKILMPEEGDLEVAFEVDAPLRRLQGVVVDEAGDPVVGATVAIGVKPYHDEVKAQSDAGGAFSCRLFADRLYVRITKAGHTPYEALGLVIPLGGAPVTFVLLPAAQLTVWVRDENGAAVPAQSVSAGGGASFEVREIGVGHFGVIPAPQGEAALIVHAGTHRFPHRIFGAGLETTVTLPVGGMLNVTWRHALPSDTDLVLVVKNAERRLHPLRLPIPLANRAAGGGLSHCWLVPGDYRATVVSAPRDAPEREIAAGMTVRIEAGRSARIVWPAP